MQSNRQDWKLKFGLVVISRTLRKERTHPENNALSTHQDCDGTVDGAFCTLDTWRKIGKWTWSVWKSYCRWYLAGFNGQIESSKSCSLDDNCYHSHRQVDEITACSPLLMTSSLPTSPRWLYNKSTMPCIYNTVRPLAFRRAPGEYWWKILTRRLEPEQATSLCLKRNNV